MVWRRAQIALRMVIWTIVLVAIVAVGAFAAVMLLRPAMVVTEAVDGPVVQAFYATGTIQPVREYPIKANLPGTLTEVLVDKGDRVSKGQKLAVVSDPELTYKFNKAKAELEEAMLRAEEKMSPVLKEFDSKLQAINELLDIAKREQERTNEMFLRKAASQTDLDRSMDRVKQLWSQGESNKAQKDAMKLSLQKEVQVAEAAVATARWNLDQQTIKSPIDGVVLDRPASMGTRLAINDHIMQVADVRPENLVMRAAVDEEDVTKVRPGQPVRMALYAFADRAFLGKVTRIYDKADPERRTFEIDVTPSEISDRLAAGMTGELAFILAEKSSAVVVPSQAVQSDTIWSVKEGRLVKMPVKVGLRAVDRTEILSGLSPGQRVVLSPVGDLTEGSLVRTQFKDPREAAEQNKPKTTTGSFKGFNQ